MPMSDTDITGAKLEHAIKEQVTSEREVLRGLKEQAMALAKLDFVHVHIDLSNFGIAVTVRTDEPEDVYDEDKGEFSAPMGSVITAGFGQTLLEAIQSANANMKART